MGAWIEIVRFVLRHEYVAASLPAWERGLKSIEALGVVDVYQSLPAWERGLKYQLHQLLLPLRTSLPAWERGLK